MQEFSIWVNPVGTVRMLCLPLTAQRPTPVFVYESFAETATAGKKRVNSAFRYDLVLDAVVGANQVSEKAWFNEGFVPIGERTFTVFDLQATLLKVGNAFMTEVLNYVEKAPHTIDPAGIPGQGDIAAVVKLIRHLHDFKTADLRLPDITLLRRPAPASRYAF